MSRNEKTRWKGRQRTGRAIIKLNNIKLMVGEPLAEPAGAVLEGGWSAGEAVRLHDRVRGTVAVSPYQNISVMWIRIDCNADPDAGFALTSVRILILGVNSCLKVIKRSASFMRILIPITET